MPKLPGRDSTRKTIKIEKAVVHSFLMPFEDGDPKFDKKVCVVEGCDHRLGNCAARASGAVGAYVGYEDRLDIVIGVACSCCVSKIIA